MSLTEYSKASFISDPFNGVVAGCTRISFNPLCQKNFKCEILNSVLWHIKYTKQ